MPASRSFAWVRLAPPVRRNRGPRWLERRPVKARNPDWRMEANGFVRRHPLAVGASLVALFGLIISLVMLVNVLVSAWVGCRLYTENGASMTA